MLAALFIFVFGVVTLGLGWALYWLLAGDGDLGRRLLRADLRQRGLGDHRNAVMDLEMRTWYRAPAYFVLGRCTRSLLGHDLVPHAAHSAGGLLERRRLLHDMLVGTIVINAPARAQAERFPPH